jgi:hypothetical protein
MWGSRGGVRREAGRRRDNGVDRAVVAAIDSSAGSGKEKGVTQVDSDGRAGCADCSAFGVDVYWDKVALAEARLEGAGLV